MNNYNEDTNYTNRDFAQQIYKGITWEYCIFKECDFSNTKFESCSFLECRFENSQLSNITIINSRFNICIFKDSKMIGINWSLVGFTQSLEFRQCILDYNIFAQIKMIQTVFDQCRLREADFSESDFKNSTFIDSDLLGTQFNHSDLRNSDFRNAKNYYIDPRSTKIKNAKFSAVDALSLLNAFEVEID